MTAAADVSKGQTDMSDNIKFYNIRCHCIPQRTFNFDIL